MNLDVRFQFRRLAASLKADADVAGGIGHSATVGTLRELVVARFLKPHLPRTIGIRSGVIIDSTGKRSKQQDIVLVADEFPVISVGHESTALIVAESVLATIEIKTHLDGSELISTLESIALTKSLFRSGELHYAKRGAEMTYRMVPILSYVFAFDGAHLQTLGQHMVDFCSSRSDGGLSPEVVCVLSKGVVDREQLVPTPRADPQRPGHTRMSLPPVNRPLRVDVVPLKEDALLKFYSRLRDDVFPLSVVHYDLDPYYDGPDFE